jgi:hypothetical protein
MEPTARWLRPRRIGIGELSVDPSYSSPRPAPPDVMRRALGELDTILSHTDRPGAILLYDECHVLADDRARERYPLSGMLAALERCSAISSASASSSAASRLYA